MSNEPVSSTAGAPGIFIQDILSSGDKYPRGSLCFVTMTGKTLNHTLLFDLAACAVIPFRVIQENCDRQLYRDCRESFGGGDKDSHVLFIPKFVW